MDEDLRPVRCSSPGEILQRELDGHEWTQKDLAAIIGRPHQTVNEIVRGVKQITPETAHELSHAFGTSAYYWMHLEADYRLHLAKDTEKGSDIERKRKLYDMAPVPELLKRKWIDAPSSSVESLEKAVHDFFGFSGPGTPELAPNLNLRHSRCKGPEWKAVYAWKRRAESLVREQKVGAFSLERLKAGMSGLLGLSARESGVSEVPAYLNALGVRFIIVPHLPKTFLDGAALYVMKRKPVVALTLRFDRIDAFWFTLTHELAHIVCGHDESIDNHLEHKSKTQKEAEADDLASEWLLREEHLLPLRKSFPYISRHAIEQTAQAAGRHPGILVGRLQHEELLKYSQFRDLLTKVSSYLHPWIRP